MNHPPVSSNLNVSANALTLASPFGLIPALGDLDAYIRAAFQLPMLTHEEEQALARKFRQENDLQAASQLVLSHLRLVVSIARHYLGYGLPQGDLIQEGNIGLMKAVKRFDPDQGVRLVSYATHWIKAEIHEYIIKNWRMVKVATTKAHRKLFFKLRSIKQRLMSDDAFVDHAADSLNASQIDAVAAELDVKREDVIEMEQRMAGGDVLLDPSTGDDGDEGFGPIAYLTNDSDGPVAMLEAHHREMLASDGLTMALGKLDERSRHIVQERYLKVGDDGTGGMTLHDLAAIYGVSAERIRQIEVAALKKMKASLLELI